MRMITFATLATLALTSVALAEGGDNPTRDRNIGAANCHHAATHRDDCQHQHAAATTARPRANGDGGGCDSYAGKRVAYHRAIGDRRA